MIYYFAYIDIVALLQNTVVSTVCSTITKHSLLVPTVDHINACVHNSYCI